MVIDAPLPGVGPWEEILKNPLLWHFRFGGPDMERLVAGRERIYLDRFWNEFSATPKRFSEMARRHYAKLYARPGAMHAGFAQFAAFDQDAIWPSCGPSKFRVTTALRSVIEEEFDFIEQPRESARALFTSFGHIGSGRDAKQTSRPFRHHAEGMVAARARRRASAERLV